MYTSIYRFKSLMPMLMLILSHHKCEGISTYLTPPSPQPSPFATYAISQAPEHHIPRLYHTNPLPHTISPPSPSFHHLMIPLRIERMSQRSTRRIIRRHKRPIHNPQPLRTILQRLRDIMRSIQRRLLIQQHVKLNPDSIARMIPVTFLKPATTGAKR